MKKITSLILICLAGLALSQINTATRDNAGMQGNEGATNGFFESSNPSNYPAGAASWWHLLDVRHSNPLNNYAMQFAGSFYDQDLWFRKTNNNAAQAWRRVVMEESNRNVIISGNVGIGTNAPSNDQGWEKVLDVNGTSHAKILVTTGNNIKTGIFSHVAWYGGGGFIGTESNHSLHLITNYSPKLSIVNDNVGIGILNPQNKLDVNGTVHSKEVKVDMSGWADYVFKKDYRIPTLQEVEKHIQETGHLPDMPSEKETLENGINLGDMDRKLLQKIEELTLYIIEQHKMMQKQQRLLEEQDNKIEELKREIGSKNK